MSQASTLKPGQIRHLLRVTNATSRHPERDCLVLLLGLTCGMRVSEIAQLRMYFFRQGHFVVRSASVPLSQKDAGNAASI